MKKLFEIEWPDKLGREWMDEATLRSCINAGGHIELSIKDKKVDEGKEEEVYKHLTEKIKEETDPDRCHSWCCALDRFCDTIRTRAGG